MSAGGMQSPAQEVEVLDEDTVVLFAERVAEVVAPHRNLSAPPSRPGTSLASFGIDEAAQVHDQEVVPTEPTTFPRENLPPHDPEVLLGPQEQADTEVVADEVINANFLVFVPRFQPEAIYVALRPPCEVELALREVDDLRRSDTSVHFDLLLPAVPQPSHAFGSILAIPSWAADVVCVLIDTRALDGRLFALEVRGRLNRSSLLHQVGLGADQPIAVYLHGQALDLHTWYRFLSGDTVQFLPETDVLPQPHALEDMLRSTQGWTYPCPDFHGPHDVAFLVLTEGGSKVIPIDPEAVYSSAIFRQEASKILRFNPDNVTTCPAMPRIENLAISGQRCKTALVVTESLPKVPVPPGRLHLQRTIILLDARYLLRDISWTTTPVGFADVSNIVAPFQYIAPEGLFVSVTGAPSEWQGSRHLLKVSRGTLLRLVHVYDGEHDSDSSGEIEEGSTAPSADETSELSPQEDSLTPRSTGRRASYRAATSRDRNDRSRSPAVRAVPNGTWVAGLGLAHIALMTQATPADAACNDTLWKAPSAHIEPASAAHSGGWSAYSIGLLGALAFGLSRCPAVRGRRTCKLIQEPHCRDAASQAHLDTLRAFVGALGGPWLPRLPFDLQHLLDPPTDAEPGEAQEQEESLSTIHCVILAYDFAAERLSVELQLPATPEELIAALQTGRPTTRREQYPSLLPALPQPYDDSAVFLAAPHWCPVGHGACFDCTHIDRRLFSTHVPEYVGLADLIHIADLPSGAGFAVYAGPDLHRVGPDDLLHTFPGMLFCFLPEEVEPSLPVTLGQMLQFRSWLTESTIPDPHFEHTYCVVFRDSGRLFFADPSFPMQYRQRISAATGARSSGMRLYAGAPRPTNASINGVPCRAVIAIGERPNSAVQPVWHIALLDCRFLEMGWSSFCVHAGLFDPRRILDDFDRYAPLGWHTVFLDALDLGERAQARPGQIFTLAYAAGPSATTVAGTHGHPSGPPTDHGGPTAAEAAEPGSVGDEGSAPVVDRTTEATSWATEDGTTAVHFLILTPEFEPEHVVVRMQLPISIGEATQRVDECRNAAHRHRFARLVPVPVQPALGVVCLLAVPEWDFIGVPVLFVCYTAPVRVFVALIPAAVGAEDVLLITGDAGYRHKVFYQDTPWELPADSRMPVRWGDVFTVVPAGQPRVPPVHLNTLLRSAEGWHSDPELPRPPRDQLWLLTELAHQHFSFQPVDGMSLRIAAAAHLGVPQDELEVLPAAPPIHNHARKGIPSRQVYIALPAGLLPGVPYILDSRPVLLEMTWVFAPGGCIDVQELYSRHAHRCPRTHFFRLLGGFAPYGTANQQRFVHPGQVVTIEYWRRRGGTDLGGTDYPQDPDGDSDDESSDSDSDIPPADIADQGSQAEGSASNRPDAGTGSTSRGPVLNYLAWISHVSRVVKWSVGFLQYALPEGSRRLTPVLLTSFLIYAALVLWEIANNVSVEVCAWATCAAIVATEGFCLGGLSTIGVRRGNAVCLLFFYVCLRSTADGMQTPEHPPIDDGQHIVDISLLRALSLPSPWDTPGAHSPALHLGTSVCALPKSNGTRGFAPGQSRPLPTPCRSNRTVGDWKEAHAPPTGAQEQLPSPVAQEPAASIDTVLQALLEESVRRPDSQAMFLAATLVETLYEHFAEGDAKGEDDSAFPLTPLSLADHLPQVRHYDLTGVQLHIGCTIDHVQALLQSHPFPLAPIPQIDHQVFREWHVRHAHVAIPESPPCHGIVTIYTDGSFDGHRSSWAFHAVGDFGWGASSLGWVGDRVITDPESPAFIQANRHGALQGELSALFWCTAWLFALPPSTNVTIFSDCTTAIHVTDGHAGQFCGNDLAGSCRSLMQALRAYKDPESIVIHHVRSHVGHAGNEIADTLAKSCCQGAFLGPAWPGHPIGEFVKKGWLSWLWLYIESAKHPTLWPRQDGGSFIDCSRPQPLLPSRDECEEMLGLKPAAGPDADGGARHERAYLGANFLTVNVQSLQSGDTELTNLAPEPSFVGKAALLREQLVDMQVLVAALQETRINKSETFQSGTHIRFCSAADSQGSYGTEIWFSKVIPFLSHPLTPVYFQLGDFLVVHWTPRSIAVRFSRGGYRVLFVAIHAPTTASPERDQWWRNLESLLERLQQGSKVVLLGDFNLHLDRCHGTRVGDLVWPTQTPPPATFWGILDKFDLWIPSTFSCCHWGPSETWISPSGNGALRLDYIALPVSWTVQANSSYLVPELDWGQGRVDHYPLLAYVNAFESLCPKARPSQVRLDMQAMREPEGRRKIQQICAAVPVPAWEVDVHRHASQIARHFQQLLPLAFPAPKAKQQRTYLQPTTWQVSNQRVWLRKRVQAVSRLGQSATVRAAFLSWRQSLPLRARIPFACGCCLRCARILPEHVAALRDSSRQLKQLVRRDTQLYIKETAEKAVRDSTKATVQRLRVLTGGPRRKQRGPAPLPAVETSSGRLAATHAEAKETWIGHFSSIEDGGICDPLAFVHACIQRQAQKDLEMYEVLAADVPGLPEVEAALRATATDRAVGLDGIPGEILHFGAPQVSRAVYALLLKSVFRLAEPVQHKGGTLYCVWKGKGPKHICGSYRGILVSSVLGKVLHKTVRARCAPALASSAAPLQVGGLPRYPVTIPSHAARLFQAACIKNKRPHALLFLDLQEAFYRIVRSLISGGPLSDEEVARVCAAVNLPPGTMHELRDFLGEESLLTTAGTSQWAAGAVDESLRDTWFRLPNEPELVVTKTGSRPGDSLSDLVFSFLFARVIHQVRKELQEADALAKIPWDPTMVNNIDPVEQASASPLGISDATWMDDLSMFLQEERADSLLRNLRFGASALIDACLQRALLPNLSRGKTETIVHLVGVGSGNLRKTVFGEDGGELSLSCRLWHKARLKVVPTYRHLGGFLQHNGGLRHEIAFRTSQAWDAFNKRKRKLFQSPLVAPRDKAAFFTSLVSTVLFHGAGTWTAIEASYLASIDATLRQMACQMLAPRVATTDAWRIGTRQAVALAGISTASTYLHVARLRQLLSCLRLPVPELWALAHWEQGWLTYVRESVHWLWCHVDHGREHPSWRAAWQAWKTECITHPGRWKAKIRRAYANALRQEAWQASAERHSGLLVRQLRLLGATLPLEASPETTAAEVCAACGTAYKDFRSWAVHAFKRHGRRKEVRSLCDGLQCPHCLRHYATNMRLCRHIEYSKSCKRALMSANTRVSPLPGQGSRKAPKEHLFCAPTLQAAGPSRPCQAAFSDDELLRPSAEVLDCLQALDFDGISACPCPDVLWERIRQSFSCVCLPVARLRQTALAWAGQIQAERTGSQAMRHYEEFLAGAAARLVEIDFVEWLVPGPLDRHRGLHTFRDGIASLSLVRTSVIQFPPLEHWSTEHVLVLVGTPVPEVVQHLPGSATISYPHEESLQRLASGQNLDFFEEDPHECGFSFNLSGLPQPLSSPPDRDPQPLASLRALTLACDIMRLTVRMWTQGKRASLTAPVPVRQDFSLLAGLPGVQSYFGEDRATIWVGPPNPPSLLFHPPQFNLQAERAASQ